MDPQNNVSPVNPGQAEVSSGGSSAGPVIGIIVILAIVILGGLYFWGQKDDAAEQDAMTDQEVQNISTQGTADDTSSIEADLDATPIDTLDAEINAS